MNWIHSLPIGMVLGQLICGHCIGVNPGARDFTSHRGLQLVSRADEPGVFWVNIFCQAAMVAIWMLTSRLA
jgi:hypothetical protein